MVIQTWNSYHKSANLYGTAIPGELVNATTSDTQWPWMATVAAADGTWAITYNLPPGPSSSPPFTLTVSGSVSPASLIFDDVRWGDVWLCVGDSAMLLPVSAAIGGPAWLASAPVAKVFSGGSVRLFPVAAAAAASPQPDFGQGNCSWGSGGALSCNTWQNATLANAAGFSALCLQVSRLNCVGNERARYACSVGMVHPRTLTCTASLPPNTRSALYPSTRRPWK